MRTIYKIIIVLILIHLSTQYTYALRAPMEGHKKIEDALMSVDSTQEENEIKIRRIFSAFEGKKKINVLFMCWMNSQRSPAMECIMKHHTNLKGWGKWLKMYSRGVLVTKKTVIDEASQGFAGLAGVPDDAIEDFYAQKKPESASDEDLERADIIIVSDINVYHHIKNNNPDMLSKVVYFNTLDREFFKLHGMRDVKNYNTGDPIVPEQLKIGIQGLIGRFEEIEKLNQKKPPGHNRPCFTQIKQGNFHRIYGNKKLNIVLKELLPLNRSDMDERHERFKYNYTHDKGIFIAQNRLGGMVPVTLFIWDTGVLTNDREAGRSYKTKNFEQLTAQVGFFDEEDLLSNKLQSLILEGTNESREQAKILIDKYVEHIKEMWRRGVFIGDPHLDNFIVQDGEVLLIDFNFLEEDMSVYDIKDVKNSFSSSLLPAYISLTESRGEFYDPKKLEVARYFSSRIKEIATVRGYAGFSFNEKKFLNFWQKGTPVPMFKTDRELDNVEKILTNLIEGTIELDDIPTSIHKSARIGL